jgi:hypothetical protein
MKGTYKVVWAPEGRTIATVEATSPKNACRKAPMPYRRFQGELYAEAVNPNAYFAVVTLRSEGFLLGATRRHMSSPFASEQAARNFALQSVEVNKARPGYENADIRWNVVGVYAKNPIVI